MLVGVLTGMHPVLGTQLPNAWELVDLGGGTKCPGIIFNNGSCIRSYGWVERSRCEYRLMRAGYVTATRSGPDYFWDVPAHSDTAFVELRHYRGMLAWRSQDEAGPPNIYMEAYSTLNSYSYSGLDEWVTREMGYCTLYSICLESSSSGGGSSGGPLPTPVVGCGLDGCTTPCYSARDGSATTPLPAGMPTTPTAAPTAASPSWSIIIVFTGDCSQMEAHRDAITAAIETRWLAYGDTLISVEFECESIVARVVLPSTVSESAATSFASSVNTTEIVVPGTTLSSVRGSVTLTSEAHSSGGSGDETSSAVPIYIGVGIAVLLVGAVVAAVVMWRRRRAAGANDETVVNTRHAPEHAVTRL
jgi:hypothetical protein